MVIFPWQPMSKLEARDFITVWNKKHAVFWAWRLKFRSTSLNKYDWRNYMSSFLYDSSQGSGGTYLLVLTYLFGFLECIFLFLVPWGYYTIWFTWTGKLVCIHLKVHRDCRFWILDYISPHTARPSLTYLLKHIAVKNVICFHAVFHIKDSKVI